MSSLSLMEWNTKSPIQCDWENLIMFNPTTENSKKFRMTEWEIEGEKGMDSGSLYSSGSGSGSGGSGPHFGFPSLSKTSKSASINSSFIGNLKTSKSALDASEAILQDYNSKKAFTTEATSTSTIVASVGSGEPLLDLKLGKRTYLEDVYPGDGAKTSFSLIPGSSVSALKRSKSSSQASPAPRCQVEGCNLDLSSAKDYHRKHRVCENHSKCPKVIVAGLERRFCQQCSRFHGLSEFDEKKRSCRKRLSDHNARRRKPQPESIQLNPARLSSSLYGERPHMSLVWNGAPFVDSGCDANLAWEETPTSKFTITKEYVVKPAKVGSMHLPDNELATSIPLHPHDSKSLFSSKVKVSASAILNQGLEESNVDATRDLHRALSLLSTTSWDSCEPKSVSHEQSEQPSDMAVPPSSVLQHTMPQGLPLAVPDYWRIEQQTNSRVHTSTSQNDSSYFQEFQLSRAPYDDFYSSQLS